MLGISRIKKKVGAVRKTAARKVKSVKARVTKRKPAAKKKAKRR